MELWDGEESRIQFQEHFESEISIKHAYKDMNSYLIFSQSVIQLGKSRSLDERSGLQICIQKWYLKPWSVVFRGESLDKEEIQGIQVLDWLPSSSVWLPASTHQTSTTPSTSFSLNLGWNLLWSTISTHSDPQYKPPSSIFLLTMPPPHFSRHRQNTQHSFTPSNGFNSP